MSKRLEERFDAPAKKLNLNSSNLKEKEIEHHFLLHLRIRELLEVNNISFYLDPPASLQLFLQYSLQYLGIQARLLVSSIFHSSPCLPIRNVENAPPVSFTDPNLYLSSISLSVKAFPVEFQVAFPAKIPSHCAMC